MTQRSLFKSASATRPGKGKFVLYYWLLVLFFVAMLSLSSTGSMNQQAATFLGLWGGVGLGFIMLARHLTFSAQLGRPLDIFEIPVVLTVMNLVLNSLAGIAVFIDPDKYLARLLPSVVHVHYALLLTSFGLLFLWIGYWFAIVLWRSSRPLTSKLPRPHRWDFSNPALDRTIALYGILLVIRIFLSIIGAGERNAGVNFGEWNQWAAYLISVRYFLFALIALQVIRKEWPVWLLVSTTIIESTMIFISGSSGQHIGTLYVLVGIMLLYRRQIPWNLLIVVFIAMVFIVPVTRSTRDILRVEPGQREGVSSVYAESVTETFGYYFQNPEDAFDFVVDFYFGRQGSIAQIPAIVMLRVPSQIPYLSQQDLLTMPFSFVPRAMWPGEKPSWGMLGGYFTRVILDSPGNSASAAPTLVGSAYLYGGLPMVAVGMFSLGLLAAILYLLFAMPGIMRMQIGLLAIYLAIFLYNFVFGGGALITVWQGVTQTAVVYLSVALVLCISTKPKEFRLEPDASQGRL